MDDKTKKILSTPFPAELLKQRLGPNGKTLTFVEIQHYIDRLNQAFDHAWSLELVSREQVEDQLIVEVRLTAGGVSKTGLGGTIVTRRRDTGAVIALADDYKVAEADAVKRACRTFGIGADLYAGERVGPEIEAQDRRAPSPTVSPRPSMPATPATPRMPTRAAPAARTRLTSKQLAALWALAQKRGIERLAFRGRVRDRFGVMPEYLSKSQASELITLLESSAGNGSADAHGLRQSGEER